MGPKQALPVSEKVAMDIEGKRAVIVGGGSGLAKASAELLAKCGARVAILDLPGSAGAAVAADIGAAAAFIPCDILDHEGTESAVHDAARLLGGIDIAANVAGGGGGSPRRTIDATGPYPLERFRHTIEANIVASFNLSRLEALHMAKATPNADGERGVIINTSSIAAFGGPVGMVGYAAAKAGVAGLSQTMARDLAPYGIRVMAIAPSMFDTGILKDLDDGQKAALLTETLFPKRMGLPSDFALLVKAIIENPMLNGGTIRLDAGTRRAVKDDLGDQLF
ncbi:NAD(P)-dependent dehydrogenase, short-chain alcohol dehydrogenase family [Sphingobium faniae]|nr:NAD(P)-dependent dehydrogenase, short-chain alcohol dehydrogenase family [Sphingobium faniae]